MNFFNRLAACLLLSALAPAAAQAAPTVIKFATLAPEGSTWMNVMGELDKELQEKTGGQVKFRMYPGGVSGDETDVVKKVRIGQLHAAGFTGVGLGEIAPEVRVLDAPWLIRDTRELDHLYRAFDKRFSDAVDKAGYVLLGWTELGPILVFSKEPISGPDDMRKAKMWMWEGDPIARSAYKALGVSPIPLSVVDVLSSLQTGLIDAVYGPPMGVVALQWFTKTKHIYPVPMAYGTGAVLLSKKTFAKLSPEHQKVLLELSAAHFKRLNQLARAENDQALATLKKQGLRVAAAPPPDTLKLYERLGQAARRELAGKLYSARILDEVEKALAELRAGDRGGKAKKG